MWLVSVCMILAKIDTLDYWLLGQPMNNQNCILQWSIYVLANWQISGGLLK